MAPLSLVALCVAVAAPFTGGAASAAAPRTAREVASMGWAVRESKRACYEGKSPHDFSTAGETFGRGWFGQVSGVLDKNGTKWAMKHIKTDASEWAEIHVMQQMLPFNMVLHESYFTAKDMYIVMPLLSEGTLESYIDKSAVATSKNSRSILAQIAFGIWELHQRGVLHKDVKAENVMMLDLVGDNVTVIDYNGAKFGCRAKRGGACCQAACLAHLVGKQAYRAWSATVKAPHSYEVDWWSFGVLVHKIALGTFPFGQNGFGKPGFKVADPPRVLNTSGLDQALASILDPTIGAGSESLNSTEARVALESPLPEVHPILSSDFWLTGVKFAPEARAQALRDYWSGICNSHAAAPDLQCKLMFKEKPVAAAECCCRKSACRRSAAGEVSDTGVDQLPAVEGRHAGGAVCCARQLECGGEHPFSNATMGVGAMCDDVQLPMQRKLVQRRLVGGPPPGAHCDPPPRLAKGQGTTGVERAPFLSSSDTRSLDGLQR